MGNLPSLWGHLGHPLLVKWAQSDGNGNGRDGGNGSKAYMLKVRVWEGEGDI